MDFLTRIYDGFRGLSTALKGLIGLAVVAALVVGVTSYYPIGGEAMVPLGADMPPEDVKPVMDRLAAVGIPHKLDRRGVNVLVPQDRHAEAKVALAAEQLPTRSGEGLESFKEMSFGATPFQLTVNYQRALQNELVKVIKQIDAVDTARVLIARPERTPFARDQSPPTASVVLRLKRNAVFGKAAAASVVSLVAHAVDGLKPENVTVVDSTGQMLSDRYAAQKDELPMELVDYRKGLEQYLAEKAQGVLTKALGTGRAVVTVNTDLNYQKMKERQKKYDNEGKALLAERLTQTSSTVTPARGTAGAASNQAARPGGSAGGGGAGQTKEETTSSDYTPSYTEREIEDKMGAVTRLTVSAVVDLNPLPPADGSAAATEPLMTAEAVQGLIKHAIGFKADRDEITVANMKMVTPVPAVPEADPAEDEEKKQKQFQSYVTLARNACIGLAVLVVFIIVPLALLRRSRPAKPPEPAAPPPPTPEQLAAAARDRRRQQVEKLAELARSNPETVSEVFSLLTTK